MIRKWIGLNPPLASRERKEQPIMIVLHATAGGSAQSSIDWLRKQGLSYHFIVERDGSVYICVPKERVAFHVGTGVGPKIVLGKVVQANGVNERSIGVCMANRQNGEPYTPEQVAACNTLCHELARKVASLRFITRHGIIQWWNRSDPAGWDIVTTAAEAGLTLWTARPQKPANV